MNFLKLPHSEGECACILRLAGWRTDEQRAPYGWYLPNYRFSIGYLSVKEAWQTARVRVGEYGGVMDNRDQRLDR